MQERHKNREIYFNEQAELTKRYVIPFINTVATITPDTRVAEIGCGEAGNLKPFVDLACKVIGYDILAEKIENGKRFYEKHPLKENIQLIATDIYHVEPAEKEKFDLIIMRDTIEHIHNQDKLMGHISKLLSANGKMFVGFPPWRMPFGGHQQMCQSKILSKLPYFHLLPKFMYVWVLKIFGEKDRLEGLVEIFDTRISLNRFEKILKRNNFKIEKKQFFLINPNYEIKFNLKPKPLPRVLNIPWFRDFFTTTCYYLISYNKKPQQL